MSFPRRRLPFPFPSHPFCWNFRKAPGSPKPKPSSPYKVHWRPDLSMPHPLFPDRSLSAWDTLSGSQMPFCPTQGHRFCLPSFSEHCVHLSPTFPILSTMRTLQRAGPPPALPVSQPGVSDPNSRCLIGTPLGNKSRKALCVKTSSQRFIILLHSFHCTIPHLFSSMSLLLL